MTNRTAITTLIIEFPNDVIGNDCIKMQKILSEITTFVFLKIWK